jgi:hypothetical protein
VSGCNRYYDSEYSFPILLPHVPGSSPLWASSTAKFSSRLPDRLNDLSELNEFEGVRRLNDVICLFTKSLHALKNGGTDGRQAALRTKSFSILFQMPIWIPSSASRQCRSRFAAVHGKVLTEQRIDVRISKKRRVGNQLNYGEREGTSDS